MIELPNKKYFYVAEAARYLQMSRMTLYRKIANDEIEVEFISERITIIPRKSLLAYLAKVNLERQHLVDSVT